MPLHLDTIVVDLDGVLADSSHRKHFITENDPPDWDGFDAATLGDTPITNMFRLIGCIAIDPLVRIVYLTGRSINAQELTLQWLARHHAPAGLLEMRDKGDTRHATIIKKERLLELDLTPDRVITVFEDEPVTVNLLRDAGYHVCSLGPQDMPEVWDDPTTTGGRDEETEPGNDGGDVQSAECAHHPV